MKALAKILVVFVCLFAPTAQADVVNLMPCSCGNDAPFIEQAIGTATQNGSVPGTVVLEGTFTLQRSVFLNLPAVTLEAAPGGAIINAPGLLAFRVLDGAGGLTIRGLTINCVRGLLKNLGAAVNNVTFATNAVNFTFRGVTQFDGDDVSTGWVIKDNHFNCVAPCQLSGPPTVGIFVAGNNGLIEGNTVSGDMNLGILLQNNKGFPGIVTSGGSGWTVRQNVVELGTPGGWAIWLNGASSAHVANNQASVGGEIGILVLAGNPGKFLGGFIVPAETNTITGNVLANKSLAGILVGGSAIGNSVTRNRLSANATAVDLGLDLFAVLGGVPLGPAQDNQVHANEIAGGQIGILLRESTLENIVAGNHISVSDPPQQGIVEETTTAGNIVRGNPGFNPVTGRGRTPTTSFAASVVSGAE